MKRNLKGLKKFAQVVGSDHTDKSTTYETLSPVQQELTQMLYDEARGHTNDMPYIASAVYNRSGGTNYIHDVISQTGAFSGRLDDGTYKSFANRDSNDEERDAFREAIRQALAIFKPDYRPNTTATHFHSKRVSPAWASGKKPLVLSGLAHKFYDNILFGRPWGATPMPELNNENMQEYTVVKGDDFSKIGRKLGGIPHLWLQAWNPEADSLHLQIGQKINYVPLPKDYKPLNVTGKTIAKELSRGVK